MVSVQIDCTECFLLKSAMATGKSHNTLSFPVSLFRTSEILALVELLSFALLTDNFLVARYEPGKESSVSVCHNSKVDLVNGGRAKCPTC